MNVKERIKQLKMNREALSNEAYQIGKVMSQSEGEEKGMEKKFHARGLFQECLSDLSLDQFNKGVLELEAEGLVRLERLPGTEPFQFAYIMPTFVLFFIFEKELSFDPSLDVEKVLKVIEEVNSINGCKLEEKSGLTVARVNRAVDALENYKFIKTYRCTGTEPYTFAYVYTE